MVATKPNRAHLITGGFPPGSSGGHDHDYVRLRLLEFLAERDVPASVANDFVDVERWLPVSRLLITYVAGPYPDAAQTRAIRQWLEEGGRWLGLHGTSGGRAVRVAEGERRRRMVKLDHHAVLGGFFLNHPPIREFRVDLREAPSAIASGLPWSFDVTDEPYMVEIQDPASTRVWLTAELGPDISPPGFGFVYDEDTALLPDGKTRALGYTRQLGDGAVTYIALGHCPSPNGGRNGAETPAANGQATPRYAWETAPFQALVRNAIAWGMGA